MTCNCKVGINLAQNNMVEVPVMDESGAIQLLRSYLANTKLIDTDCHVVPILLNGLCGSYGYPRVTASSGIVTNKSVICYWYT